MKNIFTHNSFAAEIVFVPKVNSGDKIFHLRKWAITLLIAFLFPFTLLAATKTWTGATNNDWNTGSNWGGTAPVAGDIPVIIGCTGPGFGSRQ